MRAIDIGDLVSVHWGRRDVMYGIVQWIPCDTGDGWHIFGYRSMSAPTSTARIISINPCSSDLDYIMLIDGENSLKEELENELRKRG